MNRKINLLKKRSILLVVNSSNTDVSHVSNLLQTCKKKFVSAATEFLNSFHIDLLNIQLQKLNRLI